MAKLTAVQQAEVDRLVKQQVATLAKQVVAVSSKPQHIDDLRKVWRKSAEHKAAQIKRFLYAMGAVLASNIMGDVVAGKNPLTHFTDLRTAWYYLIPFAYIAWKQAHPSMSASEVDAAPGVTIVPEEVDPTATNLSIPPADPATTEGDAAP